MRSERVTYENGQIVERAAFDVPDDIVNADTLRARGEAAILGLAQIKRSIGTLTPAQLSNAVRALAAAELAILRLTLNRLEDTDE